jgi:hypothetical protein
VLNVSNFCFCFEFFFLEHGTSRWRGLLPPWPRLSVQSKVWEFASLMIHYVRASLGKQWLHGSEKRKKNDGILFSVYVLWFICFAQNWSRFPKPIINHGKTQKPQKSSSAGRGEKMITHLNVILYAKCRRRCFLVLWRFISRQLHTFCGRIW